MSDQPGANPPTHTAKEANEGAKAAAATPKPIAIAGALEFEFVEATRIPRVSLKLRNQLSCS
jgi:hypothetical protein